MEEFEIQISRLMKYNGNEKIVKIPPQVTIIARDAFLGSHLTRLVIPDSVEEIEEGAFVRCPYLTSVVIPSRYISRKGLYSLFGARLGEIAFTFSGDYNGETVEERWARKYAEIAATLRKLLGDDEVPFDASDIEPDDNGIINGENYQPGTIKSATRRVAADDEQGEPTELEIPIRAELGPVLSADPMAKSALICIFRNGKASASLLQRNFSIGYDRASKLLDAMEEMGFIGEQKGSSPRKVYITEDLLRRLFGDLD